MLRQPSTRASWTIMTQRSRSKQRSSNGAGQSAHLTQRKCLHVSCSEFAHNNALVSILPNPRRPKHKVPPELLPPGDIDREYDESGKPNLQRYHPKGFSLAKPLPLSGTLCFGTYCNFSKRAKVGVLVLY